MTDNGSTINYPHRVSVPWGSTGHWRDVQIWLLDNVSSCRHYVFTGCDPMNSSNRIYFFSNEKDATMFTLKWS